MAAKSSRTGVRAYVRERGPEMVRRYEAGESFAAIARDLGLTKVTVRNAVIRNGGSKRLPHEAPQARERQTQVRRRYEAGEALRAIAADLGISFTTARQDLLRAGGQTRSQLGDIHPSRRGAANHQWRGGRHLNKDGYVMVWLSPDSPFVAMKNRQSYVFEHRLVVVSREVVDTHGLGGFGLPLP